MAIEDKIVLGIPCPKCGGVDTAIKDSRQIIRGVKRRRKCLTCNHAFITTEYDSDRGQLSVGIKIRKNGRQFDYDRIQTRSLMQDSCSIPTNKANEILYYIEKLLLLNSKTRELQDKYIDFEDYEKIIKTCMLFFDWKSFIGYTAYLSKCEGITDYLTSIPDDIKNLQSSDEWEVLKRINNE